MYVSIDVSFGHTCSIRHIPIVAVSRLTVRDWLILLGFLTLATVSCHILLTGSELFIEQVSRRLANVSYFIWMVLQLLLCSNSYQ